MSQIYIDPHTGVQHEFPDDATPAEIDAATAPPHAAGLAPTEISKYSPWSLKPMPSQVTPPVAPLTPSLGLMAGSIEGGALAGKGVSAALQSRAVAPVLQFIESLLPGASGRAIKALSKSIQAAQAKPVPSTAPPPGVAGPLEEITSRVRTPAVPPTTGGIARPGLPVGPQGPLEQITSRVRSPEVPPTSTGIAQPGALPVGPQGPLEQITSRVHAPEAPPTSTGIAQPGTSTPPGVFPMPPGTARVYSPGVRSAPVPKWTPQELEAMKSPGVSGQPPAAPEPSRLERQLSASIEQAKQSKLAPGATQPPPQLREGPGGDLPTVRPHRATQPETPPITPGLHELQVRPGATAEMVKNPMTQSALEYFEQLKNIHNRGFTRGGKV